jgi:hypothetical protein
MNPTSVLHLGQARLAEMHRQARRNALASAARGWLTASPAQPATSRTTSP